MSVEIRPLGNKVLLFVPPDAEEKNVGGIILKGKFRRDGYREAIVRRLPAGYRGQLIPGETVLLPPFKGTEIMVNNERLIFIREEDLGAVLEG